MDTIYTNLKILNKFILVYFYSQKAHISENQGRRVFPVRTVIISSEENGERVDIPPSPSFLNYTYVSIMQYNKI